MWKAVLLAMTPFLLAAMNHYFRHKEQREQDKEDRKHQERVRQQREKKITYDHKWPEDEV